MSLKTSRISRKNAPSQSLTRMSLTRMKIEELMTRFKSLEAHAKSLESEKEICYKV
jgi:hypothetical protein